MLSSITGLDHNYILHPVSATACLKRNLSLSPLRSRTTPRFTCDLKLETFPLYLNDCQYNLVISSLRYYDRIETARPYRKWRPKCKDIIGNAKLWWIYAYNCHVNHIQKKYENRSWSRAFEKAKQLNQYVKIYVTYLRNPLSLSTDLKQLKMDYEKLVGIEELRTVREICMEKVAIEMEKDRLAKNDSPRTSTPVISQPTSPSSTGSSESTGMLQWWFPAWGGWYPTTETTEIEATPQEPEASKYAGPSSLEIEKSSLTLEEEILYVISDSIENNTFMKRDALFGQLSFSLKQASFILSSSIQKHSEEKKLSW